MACSPGMKTFLGNLEKYSWVLTKPGISGYNTPYNVKGYEEKSRLAEPVREPRKV